MKKTIKFIIITLFIWIALSMVSTVNAASATIKANKTTATVGDSVKVTVTVNAAAWNLKVSGSASGDIIGYNSDAENQTITKTYTVDTNKAGTYKVTLSGDITDESKDSADSINTSVSITVNAKETTTDKKEDTTTNKDTSSSDKNTTTEKDTSTTNKDTSTSNKDTTTPEKPKEKSNNAYLSTLGVTPKEYDFSGFNKTKTTYSVTVPKNVDSLKVLYKTADANAKVKVSGNSGFEVGSDNKITIKVTAEDGKTTKEYTIKVTQLAEEEEKPGNLIEDEEGLYLTKLNIDAVSLSPEFNKDVYSYTATLNDVNIKDILVEAEANKKDAKIDISGNTNLVEGENTINIILTVDESDLQVIYQVVVTAHFEEEDIISTTEENEDAGTTDLIGKLKNYTGIVIGVVVFIIVAVIVLIVLLVKENKKIREEDDEDNDEISYSKSKEYNVYENDENEFVNNYMKRDNFIESLYNQRNGNLNDEDLTEDEKETLEEISKQTEKIFEEKVEGQSVEYSSNDILENPLERRKRRGRGKHSL